jgi:hypothetical protein
MKKQSITLNIRYDLPNDVWEKIFLKIWIYGRLVGAFLRQKKMNVFLIGLAFDEAQKIFGLLLSLVAYYFVV